MNLLEIQNYNFEKTLLGGQAFNWDKSNGTYYGFFQDKVVKIVPNNRGFLWQTYPENDDNKFLENYLEIDQDFYEIRDFLESKDDHTKKALRKNNGLRILNQEPHQTLLSFILSSNKSIKGVRKAVRDLSKRYGRDIKVDGIKFNLFPLIEDLILVNEEDYRNLGFGYRAKFFYRAVQQLAHIDLIRDYTEDEARNILMQFDGIGEKIAECIMVFGLGFREITPLDVWGKRILTDLYGISPNLKYSEMRLWLKNYFGEYTAISGQYLFEYIRESR